MKQYTHGWLAHAAIRRLDRVNLPAKYRPAARELVRWFRMNDDGVVQGAWCPDSVYHDNGTGHVLKLAPAASGTNRFKNLPGNYLVAGLTADSPLRRRSFKVAKGTNLPDRCEAIAHSIVDHLKMQWVEDKGSAVAPTHNQLALLLFALSHYVADGHVPFHCDVRSFSSAANVHGRVEGEWEHLVETTYRIDADKQRFRLDPNGDPLRDRAGDAEYRGSWLEKVDASLEARPWLTTWGSGNGNVWDFMSAICQHSYLLSHQFIPSHLDETSVGADDYKDVGTTTFDEMSEAVLADAADSIARIWLRVWHRYREWRKKQDG
jgi:hypothetical protein